MLRAGLWHRGSTRLITIDTPPVGTDWLITVPSVPEGIWWEPKSIFFATLNDATVQNRIARINIVASADFFAFPYVQFGAVTPVPASTLGRFAFGQAMPLGLIDNAGVGQVNQQASIPFGLRIPSGHSIRSSMSGKTAGDQLNTISLLVDEWVYEPAGERTPNIGDGSARVDTISFTEFSETMKRIAELMEAQQATP